MMDPLANMASLNSVLYQSQKTQGFCVANFATLSDERISHSKIVKLFHMEKNLAFKNLKGCTLENSWDFANWIYCNNSNSL